MTQEENRLKPTFSIPGPGGSLGKCALCGNDFLFEVLTGKNVKMVSCSWFPDQQLPMHIACADSVGEHMDARTLPPGPLHSFYEQNKEKFTDTPVETSPHLEREAASNQK